jgi:hypothetical protein
MQATSSDNTARDLVPDGTTRKTTTIVCRSLIVLAALAVAGTSAFAQAPPFAFAGSALIVARAGADCDSVSAQVGELHTSVFRPTQAGVNVASLQLLQSQSAIRMQPKVTANFATAGTYAAQMFTGRGGFVKYSGSYTVFKIRPTPTATTPVLDISGKLTNFRNAGNCTLTFRAGYVLKP